MSSLHWQKKHETIVFCTLFTPSHTILDKKVENSPRHGDASCSILENIKTKKAELKRQKNQVWMLHPVPPKTSTKTSACVPYASIHNPWYEFGITRHWWISCSTIYSKKRPWLYHSMTLGDKKKSDDVLCAPRTRIKTDFTCSTLLRGKQGKRLVSGSKQDIDFGLSYYWNHSKTRGAPSAWVATVDGSHPIGLLQYII